MGRPFLYMSKKNIAMLLLLLTLGAIYVFNFTDLFRTPTLEITTRIRPQISRKGKNASVPMANSISFLLNGKYQLTRVKVVEENDFKTNKYAHPLWHLISESNSVPTKAIFYGQPIAGMKAEIAKTKPENLRPAVSYVLFVEANDLKGQTSFKIR